MRTVHPVSAVPDTDSATALDLVIGEFEQEVPSANTPKDKTSCHVVYCT